jgi:hypothetical protein
MWSYGDRRKGYCMCMGSVVELEKWRLARTSPKLEGLGRKTTNKL